MRSTKRKSFQVEQETTAEEQQSFLEALALTGSKTVCLSGNDGFKAPFVQASNSSTISRLPKSLRHLFDDNHVNLPLNTLQQIAPDVILEMRLSEDGISFTTPLHWASYHQQHVAWHPPGSPHSFSCSQATDLNRQSSHVTDWGSLLPWYSGS